MRKLLDTYKNKFTQLKKAYSELEHEKDHIKVWKKNKNDFLFNSNHFRMFYKNFKIHLLNDKQNYVKRLNLNDKLKNNLKIKLKNLFNKFDFSIIIIIFNRDFFSFQNNKIWLWQLKKK
jgi:hypothetical protein